MSLRSQLAKVRLQILSSFCRRTAALGDLGPIVTFTFDDFPRSALTIGGGIVERFGGRATYYVSMGLMNTVNDLGEQFRSTDLHSLIERGHEVANHSFSHPSARKTLFEDFLKDVDHCEKAIRETTTADPSNNFAYPYGEVTLRVKRQLGPRMGSCRGTIGGLNGPDVDLNLLRANRLYGGIEQFDDAKRLILENEMQRSWLIFYSHDIDRNPSRFGCTPALLEEVVSFAANRGARIMTVSDVLTELCCTAQMATH
jgi:peptidoglycan/xylan/chitin deacetylase (PgdA/CDA1 family)